MVIDPSVELLWWAGCPSHRLAMTMLEETMRELGLDPATIACRQIVTDDDAAREMFIGSPTIRVAGHDIVENIEESAPALTCRLYYRRDGRPSPLPDIEDVRDALRRLVATREGRDGPSRRAGTGITGTWETNTRTPFGDQTAELTLVDDGTGNLSGANVTPMGTMTIESGRVDGNEATLVLKMKAPMAMTFNVTILIDGDVMTGSVKAGLFGSSPFEGKRIA